MMIAPQGSGGMDTSERGGETIILYLTGMSEFPNTIPSLLAEFRPMHPVEDVKRILRASGQHRSSMRTFVSWPGERGQTQSRPQLR